MLDYNMRGYIGEIAFENCPSLRENKLKMSQFSVRVTTFENR